MRDRDQQKKPNWLSLAVVFLLLAPNVAIPLGILAGIVYMVFHFLKAGQTSTGSRKSKALEDCPKQLFCFHKDKGEHHVARGKEIDPWDRPDIDISKYQRKG